MPGAASPRLSSAATELSWDERGGATPRARRLLDIIHPE
eukprot:gene19945-3451_t